MITVHINARDHEEAHVASAKFTLHEIALPLLEEEVARQLAVTVRWAEEMEMLIGHAKAYLSWGGEEARMLSTTGGEVEAKGSELPAGSADAEVGITVIVFGGELEDAEDRLEGMSAAIAGRFGEWCVYDHECEHHHHHDHEHEHHHEHDHEHEHEHDHGHEHDRHAHEHHEHGEDDRCE